MKTKKAMTLVDKYNDVTMIIYPGHVKSREFNNAIYEDGWEDYDYIKQTELIHGYCTESVKGWFTVVKKGTPKAKKYTIYHL
jgi:hypothetical protein